MKTLNKLLLTNWHYFSHEVMHFGQINFLTGLNGSGKTTIIDALQLLMLGDTNGRYFNKSASEKSSRSLKGYIRCEIGDKDDGTVLYLRNGRFTSYIANEFYDDENDETFTLGIVFDSYEDGTHDNKFFYIQNKIPENEFIENNIPLTQKQLNLYLLNNNYNFKFFQSNIDYREFIKIKLGNLSDSFFSLFKKAIPFTPINNIEDFISEYVCDTENTIDVEKMQENFRNYKKLEIEAADLAKRTTLLTDIVNKYNEYDAKQKEIMTKKYIMDRSDLYLAIHSQDAINQKVEELNADIEIYKEQIAKCDEILESANSKKVSLLEEKFQSDVFKRRAVYEQKYQALTQNISEIEESLEKVKRNLSNYVLNYSNAINDILLNLPSDFITSENGKNAQKLLKLFDELEDGISKDNVAPQLLVDIFNLLNEFNTEIKRYQFQLLGNLDDIETRVANLNKELVEINAGKKPYDPRLITFKEAIREGLKQRFKKDVEVNFFSDLIDIKDESWRKAIETYLNTQRFYLIIKPEYVGAAIQIYDRLKGSIPYYEYGIVDTEKVLLNNKEPLANSLATEISSNSQEAIAYANTLLGALIKCNNINNLRNYARCITKDGMLYQGYVARHLNINATVSFIGSGSALAQKEIKENEIKSIKVESNKINISIYSLNKLTALESLNSNEVKNSNEVFETAKRLPSLKEEASSAKDAMDGISDNFLENIDKNISKLDHQIADANEDKQDLNNDITKARLTIDRYLKEELPLAKDRVKLLKEKINKDYKRDWIAEEGEPKFLDLLKENANPMSIYNAYKIEIENVINLLNNQWRNICDTRNRYNTIYDLNYDSHNPTNDDYDKEYHELVEIKMKEYNTKIIEAKNNAMKEFRNDFLAKLKANFDTVISQINNLNQALEYARFGSDTYHFSCDPRVEYKDYYTMINDPLLLTGTDIEGKEFNKKYHTIIENLFRQITFTDSDDARSELEKNIAKFTDYKSYLKFDLIVTSANGYKQRLSKTLGSKSGGETQTPFYISVLASFAQTYRLYMKNEKHSPIRLIIFDEAFSKMDETRVDEAVKLLRNFNLQAIVSAPSDKVKQIAPLADKTICVVRDNTLATAREFAEKQ